MEIIDKAVNIDNGLVERIKSIRNQCDMFLMLHEMDGANRVIATLLEDIHFRSQLIIDDYCIEGLLVNDSKVPLSHCTDNPFDCND